MPRLNERSTEAIRPLEVTRHYTGSAPGSVLIKAGRTTVLCTASLEPKVPDWLAGKGKGWVTAEYNMLPGSTSPRKRREREKLDGRTTEIQRLIGRSLRAITDLYALGEHSIVIDCDVLEADGGTRTASITGALIALVDAIALVKDQLPDPSKYPLTDSIAAMSVGIVNGVALCDLDYSEDVAAEVDMNVVMTGRGKFVELQGTGEEATFDEAQLAELIRLAKGGIADAKRAQQKALGTQWPFA